MAKLIIALSLIFFISFAHANDAVMAVAPNEMIFEKTPELSMVDETLIISKKSQSFYDQHYTIDVTFHFKNTSDQAITRNIAFALPPVICHVDTNVMWQGLDSSTSKGLKDFTLTVNGKPVKFAQRAEAEMQGKKITGLLTRLGIPLNPCLIKTDSHGEYDAKYRQLLKDNHLLKNNEIAWKENIYFEWSQTFLPGKLVTIQHHYTPVNGATVATFFTAKDIESYLSSHGPALVWNRELSSLSETNPDLVKTQNGKQRYCLFPSWVLYRLTTGSYWQGGIGDFKLIVLDETKSPFAVNEFYKPGDNIEKTADAGQMIISIKNFDPKKDLLVLFTNLPQDKKDKEVCK